MTEKILFNLTVSEFIDALKEGLGLTTTSVDNKEVKKNYVYGYAGLQQLLGCSLSTAYRLKKSGAIDPAISQHGHIMVIDADLVVDLLNIHKHGFKYNIKLKK